MAGNVAYCTATASSGVTLPDISQVIKSNAMRWIGHVARMGGGGREMSTVICRDTSGKRPLGKCRNRWGNPQ